MSHAFLQVVRRDTRTHLKHLDVVGLHIGLERRKIDHAGAGRTMVASRELNIVDVKSGEALGQRTEVHGMMNEPQVRLDLGMAGIVPVAYGGAGKLPEK